MNVDIMNEIVTAYDNGEPTIGDLIIEKWAYDEGTVRMRRASANFIYEFQNKNQNLILRIAPDTERTKQQILAELDFMKHLKNNNYNVPKIIPSLTNNLVETLKTEKRSYFSVVFEKCPGKHFEIDTIPSNLIVKWGRLTALVHHYSQTFKPKAGRKRRDWTDDIMRTLRWLPTNEFELKEILLELIDEINEFPKNEYFGLIHFDLELDNILWNKKDYFVIDFDDAAYYHYMADLGFALEEIREKAPKVKQKILTNFINGYKQVKSLPSNWKEQLNCFFNLLDILKYVRCLKAYDNTNQANFPDWLRKLHNRHMNSLKKTKKKLIQHRRVTC